MKLHQFFYARDLVPLQTQFVTLLTSWNGHAGRRHRDIACKEASHNKGA
jgi:hypothetical protein